MSKKKKMCKNCGNVRKSVMAHFGWSKETFNHYVCMLTPRQAVKARHLCDQFTWDKQDY